MNKFKLFKGEKKFINGILNVLSKIDWLVLIENGFWNG